MDRQLFVIGEEIWSSIDRDVVISTCDALQELNIFEAPFEEFDLRVSTTKASLAKFMKFEDQYLSSLGDDASSTTTFRYKIKKIEEQMFFQYKRKLGNKFIDKKNAEKLLGIPTQSADFFADLFLSTLIALLATKNVEKETETIKKHGPKSRKRPREYRYITTIKIGKITETMRSEASGERAPVRAHLRRGHIRNQRIGEGRKDVKQIFIQPVFVNADDGWIENQRKEYRIKI